LARFRAASALRNSASACAVVGEHGDAALRRQPHLAPADVERRGEHVGALQAARHALGVGDVGQHEREDVAADARDTRAVAEGVHQPLAHCLEQRVARLLAERVVDRLEAIDVGDDQRELVPAARRFDRLRQALLEQIAVRQAGQRVVQRHVRDAVLLRHQLEGERHVGGEAFEHAQLFVVEEPGLARVEHHHARHRAVERERQAGHRIDAGLGVAHAQHGTLVGRDVVGDHRARGAQRLGEQAAHARRVAVIRVDDVGKERLVRAAADGHAHASGRIHVDQPCGAEAALVHRDAAKLLVEGLALANAHDRGVDRARQVADPAQSQQALVLPDALGNVASQAVDALDVAGGIADQAPARIDPALAAHRMLDAVVDLESAGLLCRPPCVHHRVDVRRMDQAFPQVMVEEEGLRIVAQHLGGRRADVQQLVAVRVDRPQHVRYGGKDAGQPLASEVELGFGAAPLAPRRGIGEGAFHRRRQAHQVRFEHVIRGAVLQRADGVFLADGAGDEDEGHVGAQVARQAERRHAVELRHREVRQDDVGRELAHPRLERRLRIDYAMGDAQTGALELAHLELGVRGDILGEQHADRRGRHGSQFGTRLVSTQ
jgi:hypothetical protein